MNEASPITLPTCIVREPEWRTSDSQKNKAIRWFLCDDGNEYTVEMLAKITGLATSTIYNRMANLGWASPLILRNNRRDGISRQVIAGETRKRSASNVGQGNKGHVAGTWQQLGCKPRTGNMLRMRPPGSFEREMLNKKKI